MWNKVRYILMTAQRDSLFFGLALTIVAAGYIAFFFGTTAAVEEGQTAIIYAAGMCRVILVLGLVIFVSFHIRRSFENREIDLMLVHPISRPKFVISYLLGYSIIALFLVLFTAIVLFLFAHFAALKQNLEGLGVWVLSIFLEAIIMSTLAMTASLILRSTVLSVLLSLGFYVLSRLAGFVLLIVYKPGNSGFSYDIFNYISMFIPRLDFFGKTEWLLYNPKSIDEIYLFIAQAGIYVTLLAAVAIYDFKKKEF